VGSSASRLALSLLVLACAKRTDEAVRRAWNRRGADVDPEAGDEGEAGEGDEGDGRRGSPRRRGSPAQPLEGWAGVERLLTRATFVMAGSPEPEVLASLATRWCEDEPNAEETESGWVQTCAPIPPVRVDGHVFTLEIGAVGVIGLVTADLSRADATSLVHEALDKVKGLCASPFKEVAATAYHTCPIEGGSTLAVGHFARGRSRSGWGISISVLGAS
jgi:hypothetical protein